SGGGGVIGPGDVQWMTAGDGIVHEEYHSEAYSAKGGPFEMVQLWVNLPAAHKRAPAAYQALRAADIPVVELPDGAGQIRVIAGEAAGQTGAARTFSPVNVWDVRLQQDRRADFQVPDGHTLLVIALEGTLQVNDEAIVRPGQMAELTQAGQDFTLEANADAKVLVLSGQPLDEPVVGYGPFVMNSQAEIREAIHDFNSGRLGRPR
ncbi:MAG: pirin family protein, partial [Algiphilus sp.]